MKFREESWRKDLGLFRQGVIPWLVVLLGAQGSPRPDNSRSLTNQASQCRGSLA